MSLIAPGTIMLAISIACWMRVARLVANDSVPSGLIVLWGLLAMFGTVSSLFVFAAGMSAIP